MAAHNHSTGGGRGRLRPWSLVLTACLALGAVACSQSNTLEARLAALRTLQDEGKSAETLAELEELARQHPDNAEVSFRLGLALIAVGRATEATFPLHKAAENDEYVLGAGLVLASTLAQTGNHADALRAADRVLEKDPENDAALLLRAASAVELHDGKVALESADRLVAKAADNRAYRMVRAAALAESDRLDEAENEYEALLAEDVDETQPQAKARACQALVRFILDKRKDPDRGVEQVKSCVRENPEDPDMVTMLAGFLEELERRDDMIEILEQALEASPDATKLREGLLDQLVRADRVDEAKERAEKWASEDDDATSWRQAATMRRRLGDLPGALEAVEKAVELSATPEDELRFFHAELLIELRRFDEAKAEIEKVSGELYKTVLRGRLAQEQGDAKTALELYGKASIDWPHNFGLRVLAARAAFSLGDLERAKSDLLEATRQAPKETDAALWLARVYFAEGNFQDTVSFAARHLRERGLVEPSAHLLIAEAMAAANRMQGAIGALEDLEKAQEGEFRSVAWAERARLAARSEPGPALDELVARVDGAKLDLGDPDERFVLDELFDLHLQTGRAAAMQQRLDALVAKHPESAHLMALRGRLALVQGNLPEAEQRFAKALELEPNNDVALSGEALLHRNRGDLAKAIELMNQAAAAAPGSADYPYMAARMTLDLGKREEAKALFEKALRDHPESAGAANDLAVLLAEDGNDLPAAQRYAERAVRLKPGPETLDTLGFVKLRQGAAEEAVSLFERALARQPDYATARYHLALALIDKGEPEAAKTALSEALNHSFPEEQEARKVLARIDSGEVKP